MKRIYFYGRFTRICSILSLLMMLGVAVSGLFLAPEQIWVMIVLIVVWLTVLLYVARRMYTYRILIDTERDRIYFILGIDKSHRYERQFSRIERIEPIKEKGSFHFLVTHMSGMQEKLTYSFVRGGFVEMMQYRRLGRVIRELMAEKSSADRADRQQNH